jgi:N-acetylated-alpha-linked acidic dipeptidase
MKYLICVCLLAASAPLAAEEPIRGFPASQWKMEREREARVYGKLDAGRIRQTAQRMSAVPHAAGSPASRAVAEYALAQMREAGLDARIEEFEALLPYPTRRMLEMTAPVPYRARLAEAVIDEDPDSGQSGQLPTFNAYSASGDVTAPIVYVNYGVPEDYQWLSKMGIDVKGRIVLARYGKSWRGTKPKVAAEHGAVGCLIYSDPRDDGYFRDDVYPKGPMRPPSGAQRGSVMDMPLYVGDPLSPGWASERGSRRLGLAEARTIMTIPVLPISYQDAQPLLENLGGKVVPEPWRGALPVTYHAGPGPATVHLAVDFDWTTKPLYNVVATIRGAVEPDQWVIYGNHHDAWVNGASDPVSAAAALLETARGLAELVRGGWRPRRTVMLALWDGEEFGLVGSTEWAEKHGQELRDKAVLYINSDANGKGWLNGGGSATLDRFVREVARDTADPADSGKSVLEAAEAAERRKKEEREPAERPAAVAEEDNPAGLHLEALGAGSDYVAFLHHIGIASLNLSFSGVGGGGVYHSIYDSWRWYTRFSDGDFKYGKGLAAVMATAIERMADAEVLPFEFGTLAGSVRRYVEEIRKKAGKNAGKLDTRELEAAVKEVESASAAYEAALAPAVKALDGGPAGANAEARQAALAALNRTIAGSERTLASGAALPGRDWYRYKISAPGMFTGYDAKTLPGIREAVEAGRWEEANREAQSVAAALRAFRGAIGQATAQLQSLAR